MTIPALINNIRAIRLRSQFNKAHAEIQLAFKMMADNESVAPEDYPGTATFYKQYMKYFKSAFDCQPVSIGMNKNLPCYHKTLGKPYKSLDGQTDAWTSLFDDGQIGLMDGVLILFENHAGNLHLSVDIDGYNNRPNQYGVDLFTFDITDEGLLPMGNAKTKYNDMAKYCNPNGSGNLNGIACTEKAIKDSNYFKNLYKNNNIK